MTFKTDPDAVLRIAMTMLDPMRTVRPVPTPEEGAEVAILVAAAGLTSLPVAVPMLETVKWGVRRFLSEILVQAPQVGPFEIVFSDGSAIKIQRRKGGDA